MARIGLGRHGEVEPAVGDPLDGLVNLFDLGVVLAVAFLILGLGLSIDPHTHRLAPRSAAAGAAQLERPDREGASAQPRGSSSQQVLPSTANAPQVSGRGQAVGTVYRLANGQLVLVRKPTRSR